MRTSRHVLVLDKFSALLSSVYEAAQDGRRWDGVLAAIADHIGAAGGMIVRHGIEGGSIITSRLDPDLTTLYMNRYADNPYARALARSVPGRPLLTAALASTAEVRRTAFHADILAPQRVADISAMSYAPWTRGGASGGLAFTMNARQARAAGVAQDRFARLAPHLCRALDLAAALAGNAAWEAAASPQALALLAGSGRVLRLNAAAERLLRGDDGLGIAAGPADAGRLAARSPGEDSALRRLVGAAWLTGRGEGEAAGGSLRVTRPSGRPAYVLLVAPLPPAQTLFAGPDGAAVLVAITDPAHGPDVSELATAFGLTPAEARVAALVASGAGLPEAARRLGLSHETVRTHLARCYAKTGAHSRAALARLAALLSRPVRGGSPGEVP